MYLNTVVSNHFHSVKILLFSSARSRDFAGIFDIELPVYRVNVHNQNSNRYVLYQRSILNLKKTLTFSVKDRYQLNYYFLYQRLQCRDNYLFKIKFVFFLYLRLSASSKRENDLPVCIYFWYQTDSGVPNTIIYSAVSLSFPYYNYL